MGVGGRGLVPADDSFPPSPCRPKPALCSCARGCLDGVASREAGAGAPHPAAAAGCRSRPLASWLFAIRGMIPRARSPAEYSCDAPRARARARAGQEPSLGPVQHRPAVPGGRHVAILFLAAPFGSVVGLGLLPRSLRVGAHYGPSQMQAELAVKTFLKKLNRTGAKGVANSS